MPRIERHLAADERSLLDRMSSKLDSWGCLSKKAQTILLFADGKGKQEISRLISVSRPTVDKWLREFDSDRSVFMSGLEARHDSSAVQRLVVTTAKTGTMNVGYVVDADIASRVVTFDPCIATDAVRCIAETAKREAVGRIELIVDSAELPPSALASIRRYASNNRRVFAIRRKMSKDDILFPTVQLCLRAAMDIAAHGGVSQDEFRSLIGQSNQPPQTRIVSRVVNNPVGRCQITRQTGKIGA